MKKLIFVLMLTTSTMSWATSDPTKNWYFVQNSQGYEIYIDMHSVRGTYNRGGNLASFVDFWIWDNVAEEYYKLEIACRADYLRWYHQGTLAYERHIDPGYFMWHVTSNFCGSYRELK